MHAYFGIGSVLSGLLSMLVLTQAACAQIDTPLPMPVVPQLPYQVKAVEGWQALQGNHSDSAVECFMEARDLGMSKDSLYYFLAESARLKLAYDTALTFNLSIVTPAAGPFRNAVWNQRYVLYVQAGLRRDAEALADSFPVPKVGVRARAQTFDFRVSSGYFREDNYPVHELPFGQDLSPPFLSKGWQFRNRAAWIRPLPISSATPISAGFAYDAMKSYAKDSLDYRMGLSLKADRIILDSLSLAVSAEGGQVSGTGWVTAYKLEAAYLSFSGTGITFLQGGYESEWTGSWGRRFEGLWISLYRDLSLTTGRGFNFSLSASGIRVGALRESNNQPVMYVDDVTKAKPVHFRDGNFQDTLPGQGISTYLQYTSAVGSRTIAGDAPQSFLAVLPNLGYAFTLPGKLTCELATSNALNFFPEAYTWQDAPVPVGVSPTSVRFHGLALNRADGRYYAAYMTIINGGFTETYATVPMREKRTFRVDSQAGADLSLRRRFNRWGSLAAGGTIKKNWSTLGTGAVIPIPDWDAGISLTWNRSWEWL